MSYLSDYYAVAANATTPDAVEDSLHLAIAMLVGAGYTADAEDTTGTPIEDAVQTHLMIVLMRAPQLRDVLTATGVFPV